MSTPTQPRDQKFGASIRVRRERRHLTQPELAEIIGVSARTISAWERGVRPRPRHRRALEAFFTANGASA